MSGRLLGWISLALAAAALGIAVGFLFASRSGSTVQEVVAPVPATTSPSTAVPKRRSSTPQRTRPRAPGARRVARSDHSAFWSLVDQTRNAAGEDTERQSELLQERLTRLSPAAIVRFDRIRHRLDRQAYTWRMWGAATVIEDGCSDDCFRDFRAYVISLGRKAYERALRDPDSLASVARNPEAGNWENADDVAPDAYSSVTGRDFPLDDSDLSGRPAGKPLDLSGSRLAHVYPRLAARFR
jgi:Protein of unknown function (DUF4240)